MIEAILHHSPSDTEDIVALIRRYNPGKEKGMTRWYTHDHYAQEFKRRGFQSVSKIIIQLIIDREAGKRFFGLPPLEAHLLSVEDGARQDVRNFYLGVGSVVLAVVYGIYALMQY